MVTDPFTERATCLRAAPSPRASSQAPRAQLASGGPHRGSGARTAAAVNGRRTTLRLRKNGCIEGGRDADKKQEDPQAESQAKNKPRSLNEAASARGEV